MMGDSCDQSVNPVVLAGKCVEEAQGPSQVSRGWGKRKQVQNLLEKEPLGLLEFSEDSGKSLIFTASPTIMQRDSVWSRAYGGGWPGWGQVPGRS